MPQGLGGASEVPPLLLSNIEGWLGGGDDHDDVDEEGMYCGCGGHNVLITIFPESLLSTLAFTLVPCSTLVCAVVSNGGLLCSVISIHGPCCSVVSIRGLRYWSILNLGAFPVTHKT